MKKTKLMLSTILVLSIILGLGGCAEDNKKSPSSETKPVVDTSLSYDINGWMIS